LHLRESHNLLSGAKPLRSNPDFSGSSDASIKR
jgi:hypothetical protein